ncbi:AraC family transcriptional regulator [Gorillibacterium sp. sgz5001074]|uniref:AraC family transcriptional regulator n=1 Tax=Gorillibacterium sp. sgz5001074 TaxID=3446695 RepID=UPI003F669466
MHKKWLYRLILSYLPIFIAVVFCLILVFFLAMNETTKKQTVKANRVYAGQVMQIMDATLQNIDTMASKSLLLNDKVRAYFQTSSGMVSYDYYEVTNTILDFMTPLPMIESVYLFRQADGKVLMQSFSSELDEFGDREFIKEAMKEQKPYLWSGARNQVLFTGGEPRQVVSLVKRVPYYSGEQGLIVVNIRLSSLQALVREMEIDGGAQVCLSDGRGLSFAGNGAGCARDGEKDTIRQVSPYTGYQVLLGFRQGSWYSLISDFMTVWYVLGLIVVLGGIAAMTYISHRHYRPLEQLLERVQTFGQRHSSLLTRTAEDDDFAFIDHALVSLIEQTNDYEKQQAEGILYRRVHLFKELLDGTRVLTRENLSLETQKLGLAFPLGTAVFGMVEIDYYEAFTSQYSLRDQSLFKFTVRSAIQEIAEEEGVMLWTEWIAPNRLGLLYPEPQGEAKGSPAGEPALRELTRTMADRARQWVEQYLAFTVTFGFGPPVQDASELPAAYQHAVAAAERKLVSGPNRVYVYDGRSAEGGIRMDALLQELKEAAQLFRLGNPDWEERFNRSFASLTSGEYGKEEITRIVQTFKAQVIRDMEEAPHDLLEAWRKGHLEAFQSVPEHYEWIEEARQALLAPLAAAGAGLQALRAGREQYTQAAQIRAYIGEHYTDPNLSLAQISEAFGMNLKTLSRIFKEEFGEKFVDYLTKLRIERAKRLLEETGDSVQSIAEQVGYLYPMSFIRVFKKSEGITPGDYRKERDSRRSP